jgi:glycine/D-amino acid oxidase-like deaminating enzyme
MSQTPFPLSPSLWAATAAPPPDTHPLTQSAQADVLVVGGGYAGLSTALHLAEQGVRVVVLEAREIGFGGSGRNGGQVIPGLKYDPDALVSMFGGERGERLVRFAGATADSVFNLIERHAMDVPHVRSGWIQGAHTPAALELAHARAAQWARHGADAQPLDKAQVARLIGTDRYLGGWIDRRAGAVQPLSYARGLARAALNAGAVIHTDTPVTGLKRDGGKWTATTADGASVTADRVVMCTNAYGADLLPGLKTSIIDANTFQVATAPLPERLRAGIFPEGQVTSDTRNLLLYFRLDHQGRLHEPQPGLLVDIGCQGRGVGLQTSMGRAMAQYLVSGDAQALPVPLSPVKSFPLYGLRRLYVNAVVTWYRMTDGGV